MEITEYDIIEFVSAQNDFMEPDIYAFLYNLSETPFMQMICEQRLKERAKMLGFTAFDKMYAAWKKSNRFVSDSVDLSELPVQIELGSWKITKDGMTLDTDKGKIESCGIPVVPQERLIDIDTSEESLTIWYRPGNVWKQTTVPNSVWASNSKVVSLANIGIPITSYNASAFVRYMTDIYTRNIMNLPIKQCVSRCGYHEGYGFAPFCNDVKFCGDSSYSSIFNSIKQHGSREKSVDALREACKDSIQAQMMISASLASVLVEPLGKLPFICHVWGIDSGTGKTVAEMCAASIWASPNVGDYIKTFDSTAVGHERMLDFLNQLPLILDELQLAKDKYGNFKVDPYKLTEGTGRSRSNIYGGVDRPTRWRNSIVSCGESPLTNASSNSGAVNRVIDVPIQHGSKVINDGRRIANAVRENYGFIGREFIEYVYTHTDELKEFDDDLFCELCKYGTDKQAISMSAIMLADKWLCENVTGCTPIDLFTAATFMADSEAISTGAKAVEWLRDWIARMSEHFEDDTKVERYGRVSGREATGDCEYSIIKSVFDEHIGNAGFNATATISYLDSVGMLIKSGNRTTKSVRIAGKPTRCVTICFSDGYSAVTH